MEVRRRLVRRRVAARWLACSNRNDAWTSPTHVHMLTAALLLHRGLLTDSCATNCAVRLRSGDGRTDGLNVFSPLPWICCGELGKCTSQADAASAPPFYYFTQIISYFLENNPICGPSRFS